MMCASKTFGDAKRKANFVDTETEQCIAFTGVAGGFSVQGAVVLSKPSRGSDVNFISMTVNLLFLLPLFWRG